MENTYPVETISYSSLRQFFDNQWFWKNRYILKDKRRFHTPAMIVGSMAHIVIENFYNGKDLSECKQIAQEYLEKIPDEEINFWKTGSREEILKDFTKAITNYFEEMDEYDTILKVEEFYTDFIEDNIDGKQIKSELPASWKIDLLVEHNGEIFIEDYKFVKSFTDEDEPKYIFQSMFYYYLLKASGVDVKYAIFKEVKISKNKDGSSQINRVRVNFSGDVFEENKVYFWYNLTAFTTLIRNADEDTLFIYNIFDRVNGKEAFQMQKESILGYKVKADKSENFSIIEERGEKVAKFLEESKGVTPQDIIKNKLADFGVSLKFERIDEGYSYDRFVFTPSRGVRMSKILDKKEEIKQALAVENVRIEAPILGTTFIGIEVPRKERIFLQANVIEGEIIPLGKNISGESLHINLKDADTPHLLIAGKTGSGKSEFLRIVCTTLQKDFELVLIDPKRTELKEFKNGKNLFADHEAIYGAIQSAYADMIGRQQILDNAGARHVDELGLRHKAIIIDEYANIKFWPYGKQIEDLLQQISALGRSAGIHLILATQRPEVKIVSGALKANIGARVCFQVATQTDSRIILDEVGGEELIGKGDLLFKTPGKTTVRLQSYYLYND